jgi:hypothetical protein
MIVNFKNALIAKLETFETNEFEFTNCNMPILGIPEHILSSNNTFGNA